MRNNNPDLIISRLLEKKAKKNIGINQYDKVKHLEEDCKKKKRFQINQSKVEEGGVFVTVVPGLTILIKKGENESYKVQNFKKKHNIL